MIQRMPLRSFTLMSALAAFLAPCSPGQSLDTVKEIQEIARKVDETLRDIDRLLLETSKRDQQRSSQRAKLQQARERSEVAEAGLDQLIEKLRQMQQKGGGGGSSSQQDQPQDSQDSQSEPSGQSQQQPQNGQGQGQRNRRENANPEFVKQPPQPGEGQSESESGQQPGQQQGRQPGQQQQGQQDGQQPGGQQPQQLGPDGKPLGGQESKDGGQNRVGNRGSEDPTRPGNPGTGDGSWGDLQSYTNFLKNRGSSPKVPEKYRKYWEAYLKQKQASGKGGR